MNHPSTLALALGGWEFVALAVLGLLIFSGRLPKVARSVGKGIVEFRKGLKGVDKASPPGIGHAAPTRDADPAH